MFKIIRCGEDCCLVIVEDSNHLGVRFHRFANYQIGDDQPDVFNEISHGTAQCYFSGHADGLGWKDFPKQEFESLEDIVKWIEEELKKSDIEGFKRFVSDLKSGVYSPLEDYRQEIENDIQWFISAVEKGEMSFEDIGITEKELKELIPS